MAMLAEPKRKRKWSLNPRGKLWTNDETKIGQKLLEKMGWSKGRGLGREEQGDLEPVRLKYKNDAEGVGYEAKDDQWVAHREEFNNILGALNGSHAPVDIAEPIPVKSLEVRSKSSKARVHYHKFTRGKDLSRYSASDMACILGKRANAVVEEKEPEVKEEVEEKSGDGLVEHLHGVTTIHRGSIQEYFALKMAAVREKQNLASTDKESHPSTDSETNVDERENEKRVRINEELNVVKEFFAKEKIIKKNSQDPKDSVTTDTNEETPKKKKKKSKTKEESVTTELLPISDEPETKKKKKKNSEDVIVEPIMAEDEQTKIKKTKKRKLEEVVENGEIVEDTQPDQKKKKKKNKIEEETTPGDTVPIENDTHLVKKKKKKSKKEEDEPSDNTLSNGDIESAVDGECKKSKKKNEKVVIETTVQIDDEDDLQQPKKKKKKSKKDEEATPCVVLNGDSLAETETIPSDNKKSKKNKTKEAVSEPTQIAENGDAERSKKKKKSKKGEEVVTEKYKILEDSFVDMERDTMTPKSEKSDEIAVDLQNGTESDTLQPKKKKKKSKKDEEEAPETFRKLEDSYDESQHDSKVKTKSETKESESTKIDEEPYTKQTTCEMTNNKKEDIKTEQPTSSELKKLATAQLNERRQSAKVTKLLERAEFDKFVGSNLLSVAGYGVGRRFVSS